MKWIDAEAVAKAAPHEDVIEALRKGFCEAITAPVRHHHATGPATTLLLMPAWSKDWTGLKTLTLKSDNDALGLPAIQVEAPEPVPNQTPTGPNWTLIGGSALAALLLIAAVLVGRIKR